jgi:YD repeat-containing protein
MKNIIHYRSGPTCFKDLASHFGVFWTDQVYSFENSHSTVDLSELKFLTHGWHAKVTSRAADSLGPGPQFVTGLYGDDSIVFVPALHNLRVVSIDDNPASAGGPIERVFYPYGVIERQTFEPGITVVATTVFAELDTLLTRYDVLNRDSRAHRLAVELVGSTNSDDNFKRFEYDSHSQLLGRTHTPFSVWIEENSEWNNPAVYLGPPDRQVDLYWNIRSLPHPEKVRFRNTSRDKVADRSNSLELAAGTAGALRFAGTYEPFEIAAHASTRIVVAAGFSFEQPDSAVYLAGKALAQDGTGRSGNWIEAAKARWAKTFETLPPLPSHYARYEKLYRHAAMALVMDEYRGRGRWLSNRTSTYVGRSVLPAMGFWDTCFTASGMREVDPKKAEDFIHVLIDHPLPTSLVPSIMSEEVRTGDGQAPILSWAVWRIFETAHDTDFLRAVYASCAAYNRFWFETQDRNHNGLPEWRNGGQIGDNSPRWDKGGAVRTNRNMGEFESPDLAGFLLMDMRCLARMARALDKPAEAKSWEQKANELGAKLVARMYSHSDSAFWDVDINTGEPWTRAITPNMFIPLWAGVPLEHGDVDAMVHNHMLNPSEMNGLIPFPSVAYNDKTYDPLAYWRGIMWPHFVYWIVEALQKQGYADEAQRLSDRLLEILSSSEYLHECYETKAGGPAGIPEYNWTAAATMELLLERWKNPL